MMDLSKDEYEAWKLGIMTMLRQDGVDYVGEVQ
jgi:hypothetical protein